MDMQMLNGLPSIITGIGNDAKPFFINTKFLSQFLNFPKHIQEQLRFCSNNIFSMSFRYH